MKKYKLIIVFCIVFFASFCKNRELLPDISYSSVSALMDSTGINRMPVQEDYPTSDGVLLYEETRLIVNVYGLYETAYAMTKIFRNPENFAEESFVLIDNDQILEFSATTIKPDGSIEKLTIDDLFMETEEAFGTERKLYKFTYPKLAKGCIIDYHYTIKRNSYFGVKTRWFIQRDIPVIKNRYSLEMPYEAIEKLNWRFKTYNYPRVKPIYKKYGKIDTTAVITWEVNNAEAFKDEELISSYEDIIPYVRFSPNFFFSWKAISDILCDIYDKKTEITDDIKTLADSLTIDSNTEDEIIETIFEYSKNNNLNFLRRKLGKKISKISLIVSLLKYKDISCQIGCVRSIDAGVLDYSFPEFAFNSTIVNVKKSDNTDLWLYPFNKFCGVNDLPWNIQNADVFMIDKENPKLMVLPHSNDRDNTHIINLNIEIDQNLNAVYHTEFIFTGEVSRLIKEDLINNRNIETLEEKKDYVKEFVNNEKIFPKIENLEFTNLDSINTADTTKISFDLSFKNPYEKAGDLYLFDFDPFTFYYKLNWLSSDKRIAPIFFNFPFRELGNITISLPENFSIESIPDNTYFSKSKLMFNIRIDENNKEANIKKKLRIRKRLIPAENYEDVKKFFSVLQKVKNQRIILKKCIND